MTSVLRSDLKLENDDKSDNIPPYIPGDYGTNLGIELFQNNQYNVEVESEQPDLSSKYSDDQDSPDQDSPSSQIKKKIQL